MASSTSTSSLLTTIEAKLNSLHAAQNSDNLCGDKKRSTDRLIKILEFFVEILIILGLIEGFIKEVNDFLSKGKKYEPKLKKILTDCFNANIACNLDDIIKPNQVYPINPFFIINATKLDFFGLLKVDPNSKAGLIFFGGLNDDTLNRTIKKAIDTGAPQNWRNIVWISYDLPTNMIYCYINQQYVYRPFSALITDLVNEIDLIPNFGLLLNVFDNMYGSLSYSIQPTKIDPRSLLNRSVLNKFTQKILDGGEDLVINDSFFNFDNEELFDLERTAINLSNNFLEIKSCNNAETVITANDLIPVLNEILSASTFTELITTIEAGTTTLETIASRNISRLDLPKFRIEFHLNIFTQIINSLVNLVYSPQFLLIMMFYFRLANPNPLNQEPIEYDDLKDFLKKTKNILICIVWSIFKLLLLLVIIPLIIKTLVTDANRERSKRNMEKLESFYAQYLALRGLLNIINKSELLNQITSSI